MSAPVIIRAVGADMLAVLREHGEHGESRDGGIVSVELPAGVPPPIELVA